jgi:hypothetical protein
MDRISVASAVEACAWVVASQKRAVHRCRRRLLKIRHDYARAGGECERLRVTAFKLSERIVNMLNRAWLRRRNRVPLDQPLVDQLRLELEQARGSQSEWNNARAHGVVDRAQEEVWVLERRYQTTVRYHTVLEANLRAHNGRRWGPIARMAERKLRDAAIQLVPLRPAGNARDLVRRQSRHVQKLVADGRRRLVALATVGLALDHNLGAELLSVMVGMAWPAAWPAA